MFRLLSKSFVGRVFKPTTSSSTNGGIRQNFSTTKTNISNINNNNNKSQFKVFSKETNGWMNEDYSKNTTSAILSRQFRSFHTSRFNGNANKTNDDEQSTNNASKPQENSNNNNNNNSKKSQQQQSNQPSRWPQIPPWAWLLGAFGVYLSFQAFNP